MAMVPGVQAFGAAAGSAVAGVAFERSGATGVIAVSVISFSLCVGMMLLRFPQSPSRNP